LASLRERVRDAVDWPLVASCLGWVIKQVGPNKWTMCCPFHVEKSASFVMGGDGGSFRDRCHCFGCGDADHDFFGVWQAVRGVNHLQAVKDLAGLAGVQEGELRFEKPKARPMRTPERRLDDDAASREKPSLPSLFQAKREDCELIAKSRGVDVEAVWIASRIHKRVAVIDRWPLYESKWDHQWRARGTEVHRSWVAIDETRNVAEFRRLDNGMYSRADGSALKVWSTKGKSWPLGAAQIGDRKRVLLVEGGPDMLAAYHFLKMWHTMRRPLLQDVAVVCMLGASNRIREDALAFFKGCRVRIMVDADTPKDDETKGKRKLTGLEAAKRWSDQLTEAGAAVACFYVGDVFEPDDEVAWHEGSLKAAEMRVIEPGYVKRDGSKVKDTNDLAACSDDILRCDDVRRAFTDWDF